MSDHLDPARRLELLLDIRKGGYCLRAGSTRSAQAAVEARLAEWRQLDALRDIRLRTVHETTASGEQLRVAVAVLTMSGLAFLATHAGDVPESCARILVVDDEPAALALTTRMLRHGGYDALQATSAGQALAILERQGAPIDLVITDVIMEGTDGRRLGLLISERHPNLSVAYMSAYPVEQFFPGGALSASVPFLNKPFSEATLLATVRTALASPPVTDRSAAS